MRHLTVESRPFRGLVMPAERAEQPAHAQIEAWLAAAIAHGSLADGDRLPPEQDLAGLFGVSRMTLRQALGALEAGDMVERRRGRLGGTFVRRPRVDVDLTGLAGFTEQMRRSHLRASARVVRAELVLPPPEAAEQLRLSPDEQVCEVVRVRSAARAPLALEETWLPAARFPGLVDRPLRGSLYRVMSRAYGVTPTTAREFLDPVVADDLEAELLGVEVGSPLMQITRTAFDATGLPVEFAVDRYRGDRSRISLRTGVGPGAPAPGS